MQFDSEKPDKITRVPVAVTTTKSFSKPSELDNPEFYFREAEGVRKWASTPEPSGETIVRGRDRGKRKERSFMPRTQVTGKANFSPGITSGCRDPDASRGCARRCALIDGPTDEGYG